MNAENMNPDEAEILDDTGRIRLQRPTKTVAMRFNQADETLAVPSKAGGTQMNAENMNPDACGELYPKGYLTLIDTIANDICDSSDDPDNPHENEIEAYLDALVGDVKDLLERRKLTSSQE